jgi:hypothetical protein
MPRYVTHITTYIPRDQVFFDLAHFDRAAEWDPGVAEGTMLTPEPVGRGSRFALRAKFLGRTLPLEYEIIDFEPGAGVVLRAETPLVRSIDTITFASVPADSPTTDPRSDATVVTYDARLEPKGLARLAAPLLALAFSRIGDHAAAGLRERLCSNVVR